MNEHTPGSTPGTPKPMNLLPPNPTAFDYFHAIRALASREGSKAIFDLADAGMNLPEPSRFVCGSVDDEIKADLNPKP